jgi:hypothetical protein
MLASAALALPGRLFHFIFQVHLACRARDLLTLVMRCRAKIGLSRAFFSEALYICPEVQFLVER